MPEREVSNLMQVWLPALTALWGAVVAYLKQIKAGKPFSIVWMLAHLVTSGFAGLMFWLVGQHYQLPGELAAIATGIAGYMGSTAIDLLERRFERVVSGGVGSGQ